MAERRMIANSIIDSDAFLDMPMSARLLYYDLNMRADDDGFNNAPKKIMRTIGATVDDINILIARKFIIPFENGVVVIKHWRIHNYIRKDMYKETKYKEEKALLELDENNSYRLTDTPRYELVTNSLRTCNESVTQDRLGKDKLELGKDNINNSTPTATKPTKHKYGEYGWVQLTDAEYDRLVTEFGEDKVKEKITYIDETTQSNGNKNKYKDWNLVIRRAIKGNWGENTYQKQQQASSSNPFLDMLREG